MRAGRSPLEHGFGPSLAACELHKKANEARKEATKESAEISNKSGEEVEEPTSCRALSLREIVMRAASKRQPA
jgi:hypothetical protein